MTVYTEFGRKAQTRRYHGNKYIDLNLFSSTAYNISRATSSREIEDIREGGGDACGCGAYEKEKQHELPTRLERFVSADFIQVSSPNSLSVKLVKTVLLWRFLMGCSICNTMKVTNLY